MASQRSQSPSGGQNSMQHALKSAGAALPRPSFSRLNAHYRTPTLVNPALSPPVVATLPPQPSLRSKCFCRDSPPPSGVVRCCPCGAKKNKIPCPSGSGTSICTSTSGSSSWMASSCGMRKKFSTRQVLWMLTESEKKLTRLVEFQEMFVPLPEMSWRRDESLHFSKSATDIIKRMMPEDKPAGILGPLWPVDVPVPSQSPSSLSRRTNILRRMKHGKQDQNRIHKNPREDYLLPN
ncbi:hypothetical protein BKA65DRAFT_95957 [Rhexocercosporidium sp. MPI-PUGE-AT-0058]|nr:hypothetical protein BKA65DRAFT_95957 [Rhexocercosporidium sp. MPI-PUGE-AT-0058]